MRERPGMLYDGMIDDAEGFLYGSRFISEAGIDVVKTKDLHDALRHQSVRSKALIPIRDRVCQSRRWQRRDDDHHRYHSKGRSCCAWRTQRVME